MLMIRGRIDSDNDLPFTSLAAQIIMAEVVMEYDFLR